MRQEYVLLHHAMLQQINTCMQSALPETERVSRCFWIAINQWEELKKIMEPLNFQQESDQILFFRNEKPQFTAYIQYFTIISEALLFIPDQQPDQLAYWKGETNKYDRFCHKHSEFANYYESGRGDMDQKYFTRVSDDWRPKEPWASYDLDKEFCSTGDWLLRGLLAHEMYYRYASAKLGLLSGVKAK